MRKRRKYKKKALPIVKKRRTDIADALKDATVSFFAKGGYSCFKEIGVNSWGKRRADVVGLNLHGQIVIVEIKSSRADYCGDKKWKTYLPYSTRFYFCFQKALYDKIKLRVQKDLFKTGAGILVLNPETGWLNIVKPTKIREIEDDVRLSLVTRLAWRAGDSKRTQRRKRQFVVDKVDE